MIAPSSQLHLDHCPLHPIQMLVPYRHMQPSPFSENVALGP
jgi:hypothetical protein